MVSILTKEHGLTKKPDSKITDSLISPLSFLFVFLKMLRVGMRTHQDTHPSLTKLADWHYKQRKNN